MPLSPNGLAGPAGQLLQRLHEVQASKQSAKYVRSHPGAALSKTSWMPCSSLESGAWTLTGFSAGLQETWSLSALFQAAARPAAHLP